MTNVDDAWVCRMAAGLLLGMAACSSAPVTTAPPDDAAAVATGDAATDVTMDATPPVMDAGTDTARAATDTPKGHVICTGGDEIRLAIRIAGGGQADPGQDMLAQNGWSFLLVDGSCTAWVLEDYAGRLMRAVLTPADEDALATNLSLSSWDRISVPVGGGCFDAPGITFRFGDRRLGGSACGPSANSAWYQLNEAGNKEISRVAALGSPWEGDVRYLLLEETSTQGRPGVSWPLASSLKAIGVPSSHLYSYGADAILFATGEDAAKLRALRTLPTSEGAPFFTRVSDGGGATYQLFVRDALPFEQPGGGVPPGVF